MKYMLFVAIFFSTMSGNTNMNHIQVQQSASWINPKLVVHSSSLNGLVVFANDSIQKNELLVVFGGTIINKKGVLQLPNEMGRYVLQNLFWAIRT